MRFPFASTDCAMTCTAVQVTGSAAFDGRTYAVLANDLSGSASYLYEIDTQQTPFAVTSVTPPDGIAYTSLAAAPNLSALSAPTNLTVASPTQHPSLNWNAVSGASSYNIYREGVNIGSTGDTNYLDSAAPEGTFHYYVTAAAGRPELVCQSCGIRQQHYAQCLRQ